MKKKINLYLGAIMLSLLLTSSAHAKAWLYPTLSLSEEFDDNIYLDKSSEVEDWITTVVPGIAFEPKLSTHKLKINYKNKIEVFLDHTEDNAIGHIGQMNSTLNFNNIKIDTADFYINAKDRSGGEQTSRIQRTFNNFDFKASYLFNKMDVGVKYENQYEHYGSNSDIGDYNGQSLTYKDLNTDDNSGELEITVKAWPKTSALFSTRFGTLNYLSGKKSDSKYYDGLVGLKGALSSKGTVEGKIGYRVQNYEDYPDDFSGTIFLGTILHTFNPKNSLQFSFERTTNPTNYVSNAYYVSTFFFSEYVHSFTKRLKGKINASYQHNGYPTETVENGDTGKREDVLVIGGMALSYEMVEDGIINLKYTRTEKRSNFDIFDYQDNRYMLGVVVDF